MSSLFFAQRSTRRPPLSAAGALEGAISHGARGIQNGKALIFRQSLHVKLLSDGSCGRIDFALGKMMEKDGKWMRAILPWIDFGLGNNGKSQNETHTVSMSFPEETIEQVMPFVQQERDRLLGPQMCRLTGLALETIGFGRFGRMFTNL